MRPPITHRLAFHFASQGWRGSHYLWKFVTSIQKVSEGSTVTLPNGFPILVDSKDWISKTIYEGTYERALLHFLDGLSLQDTYLDVGANIGVTLWHSLKGSHKSATFMAFEPSTQCFRALGNTRSDISNDGQIFDFAVGEDDELRTIYGLENPQHSGAATLALHAGTRGGEGKVKVSKLDTVLGYHLGNRSISLLKIDTEGYEAQVVAGAKETMKSGKIEIIVMEVSPGFGSVEYLRKVDLFLGDRYRWFFIDEKGEIRSKPFLHEITLEQGLAIEKQWNLVLMRDDVFKNYETNENRVVLELLK